ncbi:MAG TPA: UvrD-helicase domain-containing protein [Solirubrobacterales bacterium]|nr:UvrD-helicase domain-containing protein [Solirubrobacterales bacterium]
MSVIRSVSEDLEQGLVIAAPASARLTVVAGPGTGKTFTLLARAAWLAEREEIEPAAELLVLSFSRAAVETVARRGGVETPLGRLPVSTVDSFATRLLIEVGADLSGGFDDRVVRATAVLTDGEVPEMVAAVRHVLVDEAQDVVGIRATFVRSLLEFVCRDSGSGFTVFGDSAQAIFDFQMTGRPETRKRLLTLLETEGPETERRELKVNHRMENERLTRFAATAGEALREPKGDAVVLHREISDEVFLESAWQNIDAAAMAIQAVREQEEDQRVAVLCWTNAEALYLASRLQAAGLEVSVRHRAQDRGGAPWLATLFGDSPVGKAPIPTGPSGPAARPWLEPPDDLRRTLRRAGLAGGKDVDLTRLASLLRCGACPEELAAQWEAPVTISTIHRAKGLEYDVVFVVENERPHDEDGWFEAAKVAYVAGTRARVQLLGAPALGLGGPIKSLEGQSRVAVCSWSPRHHRSRPRLIEMKISDSDGDWAPADREEFDRVQEVLRERLLPGHPIGLRLRPASDGYEPRFDIVHLPGTAEETVIGGTDRYFGRMLHREVLGRTPRRIGDLTADIPDTAALPAVVARELGLGEHGLHLRARVYGLGRMEWREN